MKCASTTLLLLLGATASFAFVTTSRPSSLPTTALAGYHYTNGAEPDPSSQAPKNDSTKGVKKVFPTYGTPEPKPALGDVGDASREKGVKKIFPTYGTPEPKPALGEVGDASKKKGLNRVFLDWEDRGFSADGLQRPSS